MRPVLLRSAHVAARGIAAAVDAAGVDEQLRRPTTIYLLSTGCNLPGATVAELVGVSKQAISKSLKRFEMAREDHKFDQAVEQLEDRLFGWLW